MLGVADAAFKAAPWRDLAVMLGGAAAALTGLVFVAASIQLKTLSQDAGLRKRATSCLVVLFTVVAGSAAVLSPQSARIIGAEIAVIVVVSAAITIPGFRETARRGDRLARLPLLIAVPTVLFGMLGSISLVVERGYGFYVAMPCLVISLGVTLALAWDVLQQAVSEGVTDLPPPRSEPTR
jgi:modulator of FtsH protease